MVYILNCILYPIVLYIQTTALPLIKNNNNSCNGEVILLTELPGFFGRAQTISNNSPGFFFASGILIASSKTLLRTAVKHDAKPTLRKERFPELGPSAGTYETLQPTPARGAQSCAQAAWLRVPRTACLGIQTRISARLTRCK